jgi:hypothetical protein
MSASSALLRPCIHELLRTCVLPPRLRLRVEHIASRASTGSDDGKEGFNTSGSNTRTYLSDGELVIQALLRGATEVERLEVGALVDLSRYNVRKARTLKRKGHAVYLAVKEYSVVPRSVKPEADTEGGFLLEDNETPGQASPVKRPPGAKTVSDSSLEQPGHHLEDHDTPRPAKQLRFEGLPASSQPASPISVDVLSSSDEDSFETVTPKSSIAEGRKALLRKYQSTSSSASTSLLEEDKDDSTASEQENEISDPDERRTPTTAIGQTQAKTTDLSPLAKLPVHSLSSLINPHVRLPKSYQCTVFGIVTWVSSSVITKPPFPPKRHIKVHDMSIAQRWTGITLAIFINAKNFLPELGTVALFRGITMQRYGEDIILNAYKTLQDRHDDGDWFVSETEELEARHWDVLALKQWWAKRQQCARPGSRGSG